MTTTLRFFVPGVPAAQGSKKHVGKGIMVESSAALRPWRDSVTWHARDALAGRPPIPRGTPVSVYLQFQFRRPASHYGTGRNADKLRGDAPLWVAKKPDADKLARAVLDALTAAGVWVDDSQAVHLTVDKLYVETAGAIGADITVRGLS